VCDPLEDVDVYLRLAEETGMKISYVLDTHLHADHVSGGRKLAQLSGAEYVLHADSSAHCDFSPVREGDELDMGNVSIRVLHTPGHTPEHTSFSRNRPNPRARTVVPAQRPHAYGRGHGPYRTRMERRRGCACAL